MTSPAAGYPCCNEAERMGHHSRAGASLHGLLGTSAKKKGCLILAEGGFLGNLSLVVSSIPAPHPAGWPLCRGGGSGSLGRSGCHLPAQDADPINFSRRKRASGSLAHLQITRSK